MNIKVYVIGSKFEKFYTQIIDEYSKRLSRYCKIKLVTVKNESQLQAKLSDNSLKIKVSHQGTSISSEVLSQNINLYAISSRSNLSFIVNSSLTNFDETISISKMSMDPGLEVSVLYEQIYRAYRILNGEPYHK